MDIVRKDDLKTLLDAQEGWCVSLYMPSVRAGTETQQNPIRFRNMLRTAHDRLVEAGVRVPDAESLLEPARTLLDDPDLWRNLSDGLAVFVGEDLLRTFRVPLHFEEVVFVKRRFYVKPLLRMLSGDGQFYVLALSQNEVRLLEGSRDSVGEIDLKGVPGSLAEALGEEGIGRQLVATGSRGTRRGTGSLVVHGLGYGGDKESKQKIQRYFLQVDRGLREFLADAQAPLLLAGVDYLLPIYRELNTYPHLLDEGLTGSPETLTARQLHEQAWEVVAPYFDAAQAEAAERYRAQVHREDGQASSDLESVLGAAHQGRIAVLFVAVGVRRWGHFDQSRYEIEVHDEKQPADQDLLDLAAAQTVLNGGTVYAVDPDAMPEAGAELAAVYRY